MKRRHLIVKTFLAALVLTLVAAGPTLAEITPDQAVEHVDQAVDLIVAEGEDAAFDKLTDPDGDYVEGDLYVFVYDLDGTIVAHLNKKLEGKNLLKIKDVKGKNFAAEFVEIAKSDDGRGWCEYWWPKPGEKEASAKVSFIKRVPDKDLLVGVGTYDFGLEEARQATGIQ